MMCAAIVNNLSSNKQERVPLATGGAGTSVLKKLGRAIPGAMGCVDKVKHPRFSGIGEGTAVLVLMWTQVNHGVTTVLASRKISGAKREQVSVVFVISCLQHSSGHVDTGLASLLDTSADEEHAALIVRTDGSSAAATCIIPARNKRGKIR